MNMGCCTSFAFSLGRKRSSVWSVNTCEKDTSFLSFDDRKNLNELWGTLRLQGTEMDVGFMAFKKFFEKHPNTKTMFIEAGRFDYQHTLDLKTNNRFHAHIRDVINSLNTCIELMNDDEMLKKHLYDLKEIHDHIPGLERIHVQALLKSIQFAVISSQGSFITKHQKESLWKYMVLLHSYIIPRPNSARAEDQVSNCDNVIGQDTDKGSDKHAEGTDKHAEGTDKHAEGTDKHAEGTDKHAEGTDKHAEGTDKQAEGTDKQVEGTIKK